MIRPRQLGDLMALSDAGAREIAKVLRKPNSVTVNIIGVRWHISPVQNEAEIRQME